MRTALVLLLLLAAAAAVGSLLPQIPNSPERVASYRAAHPFLGDFFARAGFFDVFGSWWFALILCNEAVDLWVERWPDPGQPYGEGVKDLLLTMAREAREARKRQA